MGIPVTVPAALTELNPVKVGQNTAIILCLITILVTFFNCILWLMGLKV